MLGIDEKVIITIDKIKKFIEGETDLKNNFPLKNVKTLVEVTMGNSFWECIGEKPNDAFRKAPELYIECLKKAIEKEDKEGSILLMDLFEYNYRLLMTALSEEERLFREKPYRKMIVEEGNAYSALQYRLHMERQKGMPKNDMVLTKGKGAVYTCLLGDEKLYQPLDVEAKIEYFCFTDKEKLWGTRLGPWQFLKLENPDELEDEIIRSKYRIMAHQVLPDYDYSIWVEHDFKIVGEIQLFCDVYGNGNSFLSFPQSKEDCLYQDVSYTHMATDDRNIEMRKLMYRYKQEGYPEHNGLIDSRIMVRNHRDPEMCKVMEEWWEETLCFGTIEKNCFNYIAWKNNYPFSICDLFVYINPYFVNAAIDLDPHEDI